VYLQLSLYSDRLEGRGSIPSRDKWFFSTTQRPVRLWGPPSLYPMGTGGGGGFYAVHGVSKESRRLSLPRTSYIVLKTLSKLNVYILCLTAYSHFWSDILDSVLLQHAKSRFFRNSCFPLCSSHKLCTSGKTLFQKCILNTRARTYMLTHARSREHCVTVTRGLG
jgi:hypothetical protein